MTSDDLAPAPAGAVRHLAGPGFPLLPNTYYVFSDQTDILLAEVELGDRAAFDLFHHDDLFFADPADFA